MGVAMAWTLCERRFCFSADSSNNERRVLLFAGIIISNWTGPATRKIFGVAGRI